MVPTLSSNPDRKFSIVEMAFLHRWWNEISNKTKEKVIKLVNNSQLQFNLGGWCMNDEGNPTMSAEIRQMTDGQQFILNSFGQNAYPRVGWHIDPFGSSYVTGGLWSQIGFDMFGLNRINYVELAERKANKDLEFMWKGSSSLGEDAYIWVHILDSYFCSPHEIYWNGFDNMYTNNDAILKEVVTNNVFGAYAYEQYDISPYLVTNDKLPSLTSNIVQIAETFLEDVNICTFMFVC